MTDDRRKHRRLPVLFDVVWEGAAGRYEARTGDLSMGGCFVDTIGPAAVGETVSFKLRLPSGAWLELRGEIVYSFPGTGFGVRFVNASDADWKRLDWLLKAEIYRTEK